MLARLLRSSLVISTLLSPLAVPPAALADKPTAKVALALVPVQKEIDYDTPAAKEAEKCTVDVESVSGISGWVVKNDAGQVLRRFLDTNGDNSVDQWCYFKDGIEIYRDIDANFNKKADQYRWLGTAGTRWGLDEDEDGRINSWKVISAEEVTAEVVAALRDRDAARFQRLVMTTEELKQLGLSAKQVTELTDKATAATKAFPTIARDQKIVTAKSEWVHFGASKPGVVPAGKDSATKDIIVYDNVTAVVETDGKHGQLAIGTLVKSGDAWRLFDLPKNLTGEQAAAAVGYFFQASFTNRPEVEAALPAGSVSKEMENLTNELERLDKQLVAAKPADQGRLNAVRADLLDKILAACPAEDRGLWTKQYTETLAAAIQSGAYPDGVRRLESLLTTVSRQQSDAELVPYVKFRLMTAQYNGDVNKPDADFEKINTKYQADLEQFVKDYSSSPDAAEAMLQLAISAEFAGKTNDAVSWFGRIATEFPSSDLADKAKGAKWRLESVGKPMTLTGKSLTDSRTFNLTAAKGKYVLIHYWATWCEPCKQDMDTIKSLQAKYGKDLYPVGVNLDNDPKDAASFLRSKSLPWPHLYEDGGLDSRLAKETGILTLPTMILVGKDGKVINRNIHAGELDAELKKLLR